MGRTRLASVMVSAFLAVLLAAGCGGADQSPPAGPKKSEGPPGVGDRIAAMFEAGGSYASVRAVVVTVDGEKVFEKYYDATADAHRNVFSVTKSVMSTLVGIAIGEGRISGVDATLAELLPKYAKDMSPKVARTTLDQVLTMRGGFVEEDAPHGFDFLGAKDTTRAILDSAGPPGDFAYSPAGAHLVSKILASATGTSVLEYARSRLFGPLGIDTDPAAEPLVTEGYPDSDEGDFAWPVDSQGHHAGWSGLALTPGDLVKLGALYLDQGRWDGAQIVPAGWIREATAARVPVLDTLPIDSSYGYEWWTGELRDNRGFSAVGYGGQRIMVIPDRRAVVVVATEAEVSDQASGISPVQSAQIAELAIFGPE